MSAAVLWSGGKDCFAAGLRSGALEAAGTRLVTFVPAGEPAAFRCHPLGVMRRQAAALGLAHRLVEIEREDWEASYRRAFAALAAEGVERVVTGDITPRVWPWLGAAVGAAGLALETPLDEEAAGAGGGAGAAGEPEAGAGNAAAGADGAGSPATAADLAAPLDFLAAAGVEATVTGLRAEHYRGTFLGRPIGRALLAAHGLEDPAAFHPCGERGEYHTVVTAFGGTRFVDEDPAALAHVERDGIWALAWPPTSMSDFN